MNPPTRANPAMKFFRVVSRALFEEPFHGVVNEQYEHHEPHCQNDQKQAHVQGTAVLEVLLRGLDKSSAAPHHHWSEDGIEDGPICITVAQNMICSNIDEQELD